MRTGKRRHSLVRRLFPDLFRQYGFAEWHFLGYRRAFLFPEQFDAAVFMNSLFNIKANPWRVSALVGLTCGVVIAVGATAADAFFDSGPARGHGEVDVSTQVPETAPPIEEGDIPPPQADATSSGPVRSPKRPPLDRPPPHRPLLHRPPPPGLPPLDGPPPRRPPHPPQSPAASAPTPDGLLHSPPPKPEPDPTGTDDTPSIPPIGNITPPPPGQGPPPSFGA
jgi:hypothetical protein